MKRFSLLFIFLIAASTSLIAQETPPDAPRPHLADGWTYERACLPDAPTEPPADWTFEGTLLFRGDYGIHGYHQGWDTTRVLAFIDKFPGYLTVAGRFSPDFRRYAWAEGDDTFCGEPACGWNNTWIDDIRVFQISADHPHQQQLVPWNFFYPDDIRSAADPPIIWHNETTLAFPVKTTEGDQIQLLDTTSGEKTIFPYEINNLWDSFITISPDLTRYIDNGLVDIPSGEEIISLSSPLMSPIPYKYNWQTQIWSPDSSHLLIYSRENEIDPYNLTLMDRNGEDMTPVLLAMNEENGLYLTTTWSEDSNALFLQWVENATGEGFDKNFTFATGIAFPEQRQFVDLCVSDPTTSVYTFSQPVLSHDGKQILLYANYKNKDWWSVFNLQTKKWYVVFPSTKWLIGWANW